MRLRRTSFALELAEIELFHNKKELPKIILSKLFDQDAYLPADTISPQLLEISIEVIMTVKLELDYILDSVLKILKERGLIEIKTSIVEITKVDAFSLPNKNAKVIVLVKLIYPSVLYSGGYI